jgi:hypothetical protein
LVVWNSCDTIAPTWGIWYDKSGNNNHALISGSTLTNSGSLGIAFNGTNNYLTYPEPLANTPTNNWTLNIFGTLFSDGVNRDLFCKDSYISGWDTIWAAANSKMVYRDQAGFDANMNFTNVPAVKQLITIVGSPVNDYLELYKNGVFITEVQSAAIADFNASILPLKFGFNGNSDATYFKGTVQDILIYNRVLTPTEILQNYNNLVTTSCTIPPLTSTTTSTSTTTLPPTSTSTSTTTLPPTSTTTLPPTSTSTSTTTLPPTSTTTLPPTSTSTSTTTIPSTTTTTISPFTSTLLVIGCNDSSIYYVSSTSGFLYEIGDVVRYSVPINGESCFEVDNFNMPNTPQFTRIVNSVFTDNFSACVDCQDSITTSTTSTSTTTVAPTSTTTLAPTSTSTTTVSFYSFLLNSTSGLGTGPAACADYAAFNRATFYASSANGPVIVNGTFLYTNSSLTTPIPNGYYSDGTTYWNFQGGDTGDNGTPCFTTTSTTTLAPTSTSTSTTTLPATSTTSTTTEPCYGYNLTPVYDTTCDASGPDITAYKNTPGSIIVGDILRNSCGGTTLATGFYSDGTYRYVVNVGEVTDKIVCNPTTTTTTAAPTTTTTAAPTSTTTTTTLAYQSYDLYYPCGTTTPADQRVVYTGNQSPGEIILASNGLCYTIVGPTTVGGATNTIVSEHSTCEDCEAARPTTTTTSTSTTTLPPIVVTGYNDCASLPGACDGAINITNITGGSGTGYQTRLDGGSWNNYPATNSYTGKCGGTTYTLDARDSLGTIESSGPFTLCSNTTTTTTLAPTTTTTTIIYSGLILCGESSVDYYYTGQISSGDHLYSGGGNCYVSTGTIGSIFGKGEIFGTINGCSCP